MYRLHLKRNLSTLALLLAIAAVLGGIGMLWWANRTGMPDSWRAAIEREAGKQGAHIQIGSLTYLPLQGVIATDVRVFSEPEHLREISRLERIIMDFDKTKLARGIFHLNKVQLDDARMLLPVDPKDPFSETLEVTGANGTVLMPGGRRLEIRDARGTIAGIEVQLGARLIGYRDDGSDPGDDTEDGKRRKLIARVIGELGKWQFDPENPPTLKVNVEGDVNDYSSLVAKISLHVQDMARNGTALDEVTAEADMAGDVLTVTSLRATDARGALEGQIDYNLQDREGRFDISSSIAVPRLLENWLGLPSLDAMVIDGRQFLKAEGDFRIDGENVPHIRTTGHARCEQVTLRGVPFEAVEGSFSWREGNLFLRDMKLIREDGQALVKAMVEWPLVRLELRTTLPVPVYRPFFPGKPLEKVLHDFTERKGAEVDVSLEGSFDLTNRYGWAYTGGGAIKNLNYRGVPVNSAKCKFSLNHHELDFHEGTVVFNYAGYDLREDFGGPAEGTARVGRIRYDAPSKTVEVENVRGKIWAAPMVRFFAPPVADTLEAYRFHRPPELKANGVVDVTPQGRTVLDVSFSSDQPADYPFLGQNLTLGQPSGEVAIRGPKVNVSDLKLMAFEGPVAADFQYLGKGKLAGELSWTKLSLAALGSTYGYRTKSDGEVTGRIEFALTDGKVETMNGNGLVALEKAELFSVPMVGPLTPLIGNVLNDERAGFQRARSAFCTFGIQDGILATRDFQTSTSSLNFAGEGSIDLKERTLDMTMRMNARGLLRLLTVPLRPFTGLFQFQGSGTLEEPKWEKVKFTPPPDDQSEILLAPPKALVVPAPR